MEKILISVEPLIVRAGSIEGEDSPTYINLLQEKEKVIATSEEDIDLAMKMVDVLLDIAARAVAESEERWISNMNDTISREKVRAEGLKDPYIDPSPVLKILEKAQTLVDDGKLEEAQGLLNKGVAAINKLKKKKKVAYVKDQITAIEQQLSELEGRGIDGSPVRQALEDAQAAMTDEDGTEMEGYLASARERIGFLNLEELKVEYQQLLIPILNDLRTLKNDGRDVGGLQEKFEEIKLTYTQRKFQEAVDEAKRLRKELIQIRIADILRESLDLITQTLREAEGVLVDVSSYRERLSGADPLINEGKIDEALDLVTRAQVELDIEINTRVFSLMERQIRDLLAQGAELSIAVDVVEGKIGEANDLTLDEKHAEAMEKLATIKVELEEEIKHKGAQAQMASLMVKIREARSIGLSIADYKTSHTKAKIKMDSGDIDGAVEEITRKIPELEEEIAGRRGAMEVLERLRGRLLAQEGKISRLASNGVAVDDLNAMVDTARGQIDSMDTVSTESALETLEEAISRVIQTTLPGAPLQPVRKPTIQQVDPPASTMEDLSPEGARKKLFELIPKIKREMAASRTGGETFKKDLEVIMKLVAGRDYLKAYSTSLECYNRVKNE